MHNMDTRTQEILNKAGIQPKSNGIGGDLRTQEILAKAGIAQQSNSIPTQAPQKTGLQKVGDVANTIFGGKTIGEAIGNPIRRKRFENSDEGKALREKVGEEAYQKIISDVYKQPTGKEVVGDIGRVALNFAPVGKIAGGIKTGTMATGIGAKVAKPIAQIATGAGVGYAGDVTTKLADGQEDPFKAGLGTALGTGIGALPVIGKPLAKVAGKAIGGATELASEVAFGSKGTQAIKTGFNKPQELAKFQKGRTLRDTAIRTTNAIEKAQTESRNVFKKAIDMARDDVKLTPKKGVAELNKAIKENPLYLDKAEQGVVGKAKMMIKMWKDWSPKGMIKLRQELDRRGFWRGDDLHKNSDQIINSMRKKLNEMAISLDDSIAPALEKASFDIDQFNKLGYNILGKNKMSVDITEKKLEQLLKDIDDPIKRQGVKELLEFLKARTGEDIGSELQGLAAYLEFQKPLSSASLVGLGQSLGRRLSQKPVMAAGQAKNALKLPKIPLYKRQDISPGDVLFGNKPPKLK